MSELVCKCGCGEELHPYDEYSREGTRAQCFQKHEACRFGFQPTIESRERKRLRELKEKYEQRHDV